MEIKKKSFDDFIKKSGQLDKDYFYQTEIFRNLSDEYFQEFEKYLFNHSDYENLKETFIIDKENKCIIQIHNKIHLSEIDDLNDEERFFYPLCSKAEIKRIFDVKNSEDYLLKYKAEQIIDNQRLHRVYDKIRKVRGEKWNFSKYFDSSLFLTYLEHLPKDKKIICDYIPHGKLHLNEANGYCIKTMHGNIIVVSQALEKFLYYMNLFHFGENYGFNTEELLSTFILATRIMLGTETLDFEIDSRGEIPSEIHNEIENITQWQMLFVIGHEYAHHYLNHLNSSVLEIYEGLQSEDVKFYSYKHKYEFEADLNSILNQNISNEERTSLANSAFIFFQSLDLFNCVREYIFPSTSMPSSHPDPLDRIHELRKSLDPKYGFSNEEINMQIEINNTFKEKLIKEFLPFNIETLEMYGSIYLHSYKKEIIHDRFL